VGEIVFAHPRVNYGSYADYRKLVELSGYPACYMDEMDLQSDNTYIFSTPDTYWLHGWPDAKCRIIYYCIEWYFDIDYSTIPCVEVWCADKYWAERIGAQYVPMGSHPALNLHPDDMQEKRYDVCTLWAGSYNRYNAEGYLIEHNLTHSPLDWGGERQGIHGEERYNLLSQSRMMIAAHQNPEARTLAPQRWALAAAYKLPIVSERLEDAGMLDEVTIQCDLENIGAVAANWKEPANAGKLAAKGRALYELLCEQWTFRKGIETNL